MAAKKTTKKKGRPLKFPDASKRSHAEPAIFCPADRVLALYNQDSGKKVSATVKTWFDAKAQQEGWSHALWLKDVANSYGAGCALAIEAVTITVMK